MSTTQNHHISGGVNIVKGKELHEETLERTSLVIYMQIKHLIMQIALCMLS